jgi:hypothetical protein
LTRLYGEGGKIQGSETREGLGRTRFFGIKCHGCFSFVFHFAAKEKPF